MNAIEVKGISKHYSEKTAVNKVSFCVDKGSICAILGPNGSGKTTTIKSICNLIVPDEGEITIFGKQNKKASKHISAVFEGTRNLYWRLTPTENLRYFAGIRGLGGKKVDEEIEVLLKSFNLWDKKDVTVNKLSRGMKQKVAIAMTLICNTDIILLDEPTLGLDLESFRDIKDVLKNLVKNSDRTVILSTHDMNLVEDVCDKVIILNDGQVVAEESMDNLMSMFSSKTYEIYFEEPVEAPSELDFLTYQFYGGESNHCVEVDLHASEDVYKIVDRLKNKGLHLSEIKQKEVNFERVYLALTNKEAVA